MYAPALFAQDHTSYDLSEWVPEGDFANAKPVDASKRQQGKRRA